MNKVILYILCFGVPGTAYSKIKDFNIFELINETQVIIVAQCSNVNTWNQFVELNYYDGVSYQIVKRIKGSFSADNLTFDKSVLLEKHAIGCIGPSVIKFHFVKGEMDVLFLNDKGKLIHKVKHHNGFAKIVELADAKDAQKERSIIMDVLQMENQIVHKYLSKFVISKSYWKHLEKDLAKQIFLGTIENEVCDMNIQSLALRYLGELYDEEIENLYLLKLKSGNLRERLISMRLLAANKSTQGFVLIQKIISSEEYFEMEKKIAHEMIETYYQN